jgi:PAS domain S-box-containing protein
MDVDRGRASGRQPLVEAALERAPVVALVYDARGGLVYANAQARQLLGLPLPPDCEPSPRAWPLLTLDGRPVPPERLPHAEVLACHQPHCGQYLLPRDAGPTQVFLACAFPLLGEGGALQGVAEYLTEVTAERQAEATLARATAAFQIFIERSPDAIVLHRQSRVVYANPACVEALGYTWPEEIVGRPVAELVHPDDRAAVMARIQAMLERGEPVAMREERFLGQGNRVFTAETLALPVVYQGQLTIMAMGHDVGERRRLLAELTAMRDRSQRHAAELQAILDSMLGGVLVCDRQGRVTLANRAATQLLGLSLVQLQGRSLPALLQGLQLRRPSGEPRPAQTHGLARALQGEAVELELDLVRQAGTGREVFVRTTASPVRDERGQVTAAVAILRDVTELMELDLLKDQFIRVLGHELKTPVAIMKGYAQVLLRSPGDPRLTRLYEGINRGADRIAHTVDDLLSIEDLLLGRLDLELERVDLRELVEAQVHQLAPTLPRHDLHLVAAAPATVHADRQRLERVLATLVDNAARYSPDGGAVEVSLGLADHSAVVTVRDDGIGIPEGKQARIFERFYRAHAGTPHDYGGMGVSLFIAREIVTRHGGRMWFESQEDRGSAFHFSLPLEGRAETAASSAPSPSAAMGR